MPTKPTESEIGQRTDVYFRRTRMIVEKFGDKQVTYALFIRRPVISAPRLALDWLNKVAAERNFKVQIDLRYKEGEFVDAKKPIMYVTGSFAGLSELETILLMKLGPACVAAYNAFSMCMDMPKSSFLAMDARHCAGYEMSDIMAYAASVGSSAAKKLGAVGFIGSSTDATAHYFGIEKGLGTMPHSIIGYAKSTLRAAQMFHDTFSDEPLTVLVDYFGREVTDTLEICRHFKKLADAGKLAVRIDTSTERFLEGLDRDTSLEVIRKNAPQALHGYITKDELDHLIGPGVSAAAVIHTRNAMNTAGFAKVRLVVSSGFGPEKCRMMGRACAPADVVGTGSYLPQDWPDTYATADIVEYDGEKRVKVGREFVSR